jgi:zinc/manganese transport system permease protein
LLGISDGQLITICAVSLCSLGALSIFARPLLFASVDAELAAARGVPVRSLSTLFLIALALAVAAISQITGVLLVFALLVAPAASAQTLSPRPLTSLLLSVLFALVIVWLGLGIAYFSSYPAGFYIASVAFAVYLAARLAALLSERRPRRPRRRDQPSATAPMGGVSR